MKEIGNLDRLWPEYREKGVEFIGVAAGGEDVDRVKSFNRKKKIRFPLVVDDGTTSTAYKVGSLPTLYIINQEGKVASAHSGYMSREILAREFNLALAH